MPKTTYLLTTTLALLKEKGACASGYRKLVKHLGTKWSDDKPINLLTVLDSNGIQDMLWCLCATQQDAKTVSYLMAADFAESVLHLFTTKYPEDKRPAKAIQAARDCANGKITGARAERAADAAWAARAARAADAAGAAWAAGAAGAAWAARAAEAARAAWAAEAAEAAWAAWAARAERAAGAAFAAEAAEIKKQELIIRKWLRNS